MQQFSGAMTNPLAQGFGHQQQSLENLSTKV
jgi:hypothetical protein